MSGYAVANLEEIEPISDGRVPWRPIRHHFGIAAFGINAFVAGAAGDRLINEHDETYDASEELYVVIRGRARFELDGEHVDAPTGTIVHVQPEVTRTAFAEEAGTTLLAAGGVPGKAYEARGWEIWAPLVPLYEAGDYAGVVEQGREAILAHAEHPNLVYNLACCEALSGRTEDAIVHLRQALERDEALRELAKTDTDLDPLRGEPAFKELVGG